MSFAMDDYVDVAERIRLAKELYPEMSFQTLEDSVVEVNGAYFVRVKVALYRDPADTRPAVCIAWEPIPGKTPYTRDSEAMNAETSAMGRCCIAIGIPSKKVASKDEIKARLSNVTPISANHWTTPEGEPIIKAHAFVQEDEEPVQCKHGTMRLKQGLSTKTGKDYYGWTCGGGDLNDQCPAQWWDMGADGVWKPKVAKNG